MKDQYGRTIDYLRISVTDRCNLRCTYCMPAEGVEFLPMKEILTYEEIVAVCEAAAELGIRKIKLTGGEPLVRRGIEDLVRMIKVISGIEQVTLTTNGVLLAEYMDALKTAGLDAVNISLDTLDGDEYHSITGAHGLEQVLQGIRTAYESELPTKVNVVLRRNCDWSRMIELARERAIDVRFIELMPIGAGKVLEGMSAVQLLEELKEHYPALTRDERVHGNGPAEYYKIPGYAGSVGIIHAIHGKFCDRCNRVRLTSTGQLKPCLCYKDTYDLRKELREGSRKQVLETLRKAIYEKPAAHCFEEPEHITEERQMSSIGG